MAAISASRVSRTIIAHAWNKSCTQVAISTNENEVYIYEASQDAHVSNWKLLHKLREHDQHVSSVDWAPESNLIVTCSHDRNAYVWSECNDAWQVSLESTLTQFCTKPLLFVP
mmetsp:Transcript_4203/g.10198  ORF Transcript_4203/g.10198 Transcript_4203/m.10198 type:complete len:113 (-) Transcript_4203:863-1201(-)